MGFVEDLPRVGGKLVILTIINRFAKYAHLIPFAQPYTVVIVCQAFFNEIMCLHGMPLSIVSDRDIVFTSSFWQEQLKLAGVHLHMSTTYHPQLDGQSKAANKIIAMYLHCLTGDCPR